MKRKRFKTQERDNFDYDFKLKIAKKSNECCAHCGKKVYFDGYGATVDHFVPISKGGTNDFANFIMLCENCNKNKGNYVIDPRNWLKYLNKDDFLELVEYFKYYINSQEFVNKNNPFQLDKYSVKVCMSRPKFKHCKYSKKIPDNYDGTAVITHAYSDKRDYDTIFEFYKKYCRKFKFNLSNDEIAQQIDYWYENGVLYYITFNNDELIQLYYFEPRRKEKSLDVKSDNGGYCVCIHDYLAIYCFPYYNSDLSITLLTNYIDGALSDILYEQNLKYISCMVFGHKQNKAYTDFLYNFTTIDKIVTLDNFVGFLRVCCDDDVDNSKSEEYYERNYQNYFNRMLGGEEDG